MGVASTLHHTFLDLRHYLIKLLLVLRPLVTYVEVVALI